MDTFWYEVTETFDLRALAKGRSPVDLGEMKLESLPSIRVNNYMIRQPGMDCYCYNELENDNIWAAVQVANMVIRQAGGVNVTDRYCYVTLDQGWLEKGHTLRSPGWHLDGLQGNEVPVKRPGDVQFIWSDCMPTDFCVQPIDIDGLDMGRYNVFGWISRQVKTENIIKTEPNRLTMMNCYHIHRAVPAQERVYRRFLRISYTCVPITSVTMTVNTDLKYNYEYHITSGYVPAHLR